MGGMGPLVVVEGDPASDASPGLCPGFPSVQVDAFILQGPPKALDEDVVQIPGFAHQILVFARLKRSVQSKDVNCDP